MIDKEAEERKEAIEQYQKLQDEDLELKIFQGLPIKIGNVGQIWQFTLSQINSNIGYVNYVQALNTICVEIEGIDEEGIYEWFYNQCYNETVYSEAILNALELYFGELVNFSSEGFFVGGLDTNRIINKTNFSYIRKVIRRVNHLAPPEEEEKPNFGNERARKMWEQIQANQKKLQRVKKNKSNLSSLISGMAWKSGLHEKVWDLTIYQLYDGLARFGVIDEVHHTLNGIYAGTIDLKSFKKEELDWTKIITNKKMI